MLWVKVLREILGIRSLLSDGAFTELYGLSGEKDVWMCSNTYNQIHTFLNVLEVGMCLTEVSKDLVL